MPAGAQFFGDRTSVPERARPQQAQLREFFPFQWWGGERGGQNTPFFGQPARPPVDYSKAPPPHKQEAPLAATVLVIGDSLADWLGYGLEEALADTPEVGVVRKIKGNAGLIRYESRSDTPDWSQAAKELLASEKPNAIVVMLGLNDRQSLRERAPPRAGAQRNGNEPAPPAQPANQTPPAPAPGNGETPPAPSAAKSPDSPAAVADAQRRVPGASYEFHTDKWAELYGKRVDEMIAVLKAKGVPVLWVGLPALRGPRSTTDVSYLDELYRAHAEKAGITYVDVWDGFVDERRPLHDAGTGFRRANSQAAQRRRRSLHQARRGEAWLLRRARITPGAVEPYPAGGVARSGAIAGQGRGAADGRSGRPARRDRRGRGDGSVGLQQSSGPGGCVRPDRDPRPQPRRFDCGGAGPGR